MANSMSRTRAGGFDSRDDAAGEVGVGAQVAVDIGGVAVLAVAPALAAGQASGEYAALIKKYDLEPVAVAK